MNSIVGLRVAAGRYVEPSLALTRDLCGLAQQTFVNSYDLGYAKNLKLFFNIGEGG